MNISFHVGSMVVSSNAAGLRLPDGTVLVQLTFQDRRSDLGVQALSVTLHFRKDTTEAMDRVIAALQELRDTVIDDMLYC